MSHETTCCQNLRLVLVVLQFIHPLLTFIHDPPISHVYLSDMLVSNFLELNWVCFFLWYSICFVFESVWCFEWHMRTRFRSWTSRDLACPRLPEQFSITLYCVFDLPHVTDLVWTLSVGPYYNWIWLDSSLVKPSIPFQFFFYDWVLMLQFIQLPSFIVKYGCIDSKLLCMPKTIIYYSMRPPLRLAWEWGKSSWALVSTEHLHIVIKSRHWVQINNKIFRFQIKFTYIRR